MSESTPAGQSTSSKSTSPSVTFRIDLPSDFELLPPLRQLIADLAKSAGFSKRFCFRTEIIVDELATNGITHGSQNLESRLEVITQFDDSEMQLSVRDHGGTQHNLESLRRAVYSAPPQSRDPQKGRGLVIAQMLSDEITLQVDDSGETMVKIVKRKDADEGPRLRERLLYESKS